MATLVEAGLAKRKDPRQVAKEASVAAVWLPRSELNRWARNPRFHTEKAIQTTTSSIERFGFVQSIVVWLEEDRMVAGHCRLKCFDALVEKHGKDWVPKHAPGVGLVPVRLMSFDSEKDANDYALVDNRSNELSEWENDALAELLSETDSELALDLGWVDSELEALLNPASLDDVKWKEFDETIGGTGGTGGDVKQATCPKCSHQFEV